MKFQDDISNMNTHTHTDKPKPICPPLFQSWGHKNIVLSIKGVWFLSRKLFRVRGQYIAIGGKSMLKVTEPVGFFPERFGFVQSCAKYKWRQKREGAHFFC